jgi:hypothetical protein
MSTGQIFLTLAALVLLAIISLNIRQMYVQSVNNTVDAQMTGDAINFGRDISEQLQSYSLRYDSLDAHFGDMDDETDPDRRLSHVSTVGEQFYATVELSSEQTLAHGQTGRLATIRIFEEMPDNLEMKARYVTAITRLQ